MPDVMPRTPHARFVTLTVVALVAIACGDDAGSLDRSDAGDDAGLVNGGATGGSGGRGGMDAATRDSGGANDRDGGLDGDAPVDAGRDGRAPDAAVDGGLTDGGDDGGSLDAEADGAVCPLPTGSEPGSTCSSDSTCDSAPGAADGVCLGPGAATPWPAGGFCTRLCTGDGDCGANAICGAFDGLGTTVCYPKCCSADACPDGMECVDHFVSTAIGQTACLPGTASAADGDPCDTFGDCSEGSMCYRDSLIFPDGQCARLDCTVGDDATCASGGDGKCLNLVWIQPGGALDVCVDRCTSDADCRMSDGYRCFDDGSTEYCRHPRVGDPCSAAADCGPSSDWQCLTGASYPDGYCTALAACPTAGSSAGCPTESVCHDPFVGANVCVTRCTGIGTQGSCRTGYTCADVDPGIATVAGCIAP